MTQGRPRVEARTRSVIRANLREDGRDRDICILDVSTRGLLATTARPPRRGSFVEIAINGHLLIGHVKWASERRFGVALHERISVTALLAGDARSIALKNTPQATARKRGFAWNPRSIGNLVQVGALAAAAIAVAVLFSDYVGEGLGSVQDARVAMAGESG